jgi:FKBP-type peptidyl-prolyl cis-trans isomerase FklB
MLVQGTGKERSPWWRCQITVEAFSAPRPNTKRTSRSYLQMKLKYLTPFAAIALVAPVFAGQPTVLKDQRDKASYSIGVNIGSGMKANSFDLNTEALMSGVQDGISGAKPQLSDKEREETLMAFEQDLQKKETDRLKLLAEKNKKEGAEFLAANKAKEGVKTLPSGLQYKVLAEGNGPQPKPTDQITVNYRGTLLDGTEFDSSYKHGQPVTLPVNGVIKAWSEALPMMKTGAKWQLFVPADLAYGEQGAGRAIGPDSTLIFEVELVGIKS